MSTASHYVVEIVCECGEQLGEVDPGDFVSIPECPQCEKKAEAEQWPTSDVLLAVYGAPINWPVEPVAA